MKTDPKSKSQKTVRYRKAYSNFRYQLRFEDGIPHYCGLCRHMIIASPYLRWGTGNPYLWCKKNRFKISSMKRICTCDNFKSCG